MSGRRLNEAGYSLLELMVALGLAGFLALAAATLLGQLGSGKKTLESAGSSETDRRMVRTVLEAQLRKAIPLKFWWNPTLLSALGIPVVATSPTGMAHGGMVLPGHCMDASAAIAGLTTSCPVPGTFDVGLVINKPWDAPVLTVVDTPPSLLASPDQDGAFYLFLSASPPATNDNGTLYVTEEHDNLNALSVGDFIGISTTQGVMVAKVLSYSPTSYVFPYSGAALSPRRVFSLQFTVTGLGSFPVSGGSASMPFSSVSSGASVFPLALTAFGVESQSREFAIGSKILNANTISSAPFVIQKFEIKLDQITIGDRIRPDFALELDPARANNTFLPKGRTIQVKVRFTRDLLTRNRLSGPGGGAPVTTTTEVIVAI